jgi:hypothetical protein
MKRGIIISDIHCGHNSGLTHPDWQYKFVKKTFKPSVIKRNKFSLLQAEVWNWYSKQVKELGPLDFVFLNGDAIDGAGKICAGIEQVTTDVNEQCAMAIRAIEEIKLKKGGKIVMTYGSGYHTGKDADHEDNIAGDLHASIHSQTYVDINGLIFHLKHKVGRSTIPHGKATPLAKEWLNGELWALKDLAPRAEVIVRSHIHYPFYVGDPSIPFVAMSTPAMQWSSRYGSRECTGTVDMGFIYFEINDKGEYSWQYIITNLESQKVKALKL